MFAPWEAALLDELRVARLGTVGPGGAPHLVPVCYALVDGEFVVPVDDKPKRTGPLQRLRNVAADPRATLLFDRYDDDWQRLAWVRVEGDARALERGGEWPGALAALRRRYPQYRAMALEAHPLLALRPTRAVSWRWPAPGEA